MAVRTPAGVEAAFALTGRHRHVETLTPALEHLLDQVDLVPGDLGLVAVDVGPGLFTGLRVGVAAAKGLAQALGVGVVGVTSLDVLTAAAAEAAHHGLVLASVDARRGEVFATLREVDQYGESVAEHLPPALWDPRELAAALGRLDTAPIHAVGDGAQRYHELLTSVPGVHVVAPALSFPAPPTLLRLALARLARGAAPVDAASVVPLYMREADAKSNYVQARGGTELEPQ